MVPCLPSDGYPYTDLNPPSQTHILNGPWREAIWEVCEEEVEPIKFLHGLVYFSNSSFGNLKKIYNFLKKKSKSQRARLGTALMSPLASPAR